MFIDVTRFMSVQQRDDHNDLFILDDCITVVSTSTFLVFFHGFSYKGVYFQWHSHCTPPPFNSTSYIVRNHPLYATTHWKVGPFYNNYDVTRVEKRTAELWVTNLTNSYVQKRAKNRGKPTSGDYYNTTIQQFGFGVLAQYKITVSFFNNLLSQFRCEMLMWR